MPIVVFCSSLPAASALKKSRENIYPAPNGADKRMYQDLLRAGATGPRADWKGSTRMSAQIPPWLSCCAILYKLSMHPSEDMAEDGVSFTTRSYAGSSRRAIWKATTTLSCAVWHGFGARTGTVQQILYPWTALCFP